LEGPDAQAITITIGTVPPGGSGSASFRGYVDLDATYDTCLIANPGSPEICAPMRYWAGLQILAFDTGHETGGNPLDWLFADHRIDSDAPEFFDFQAPEFFVSPGQNVFYGYAFDPSGVANIAIETQGDGITNCSDLTPGDGQWSCTWDATAANGGTPPLDGSIFNLRMQVSDVNGLASTWTNWQGFVVDANPPEVGFSASTTEAYSGTVVSDSTINFTGLVTDTHAVGSVEVCLNGQCGLAEVQSNVTALYTYDDATYQSINASTTCGGGELVRNFVVGESFTLGEVKLGFNAEHGQRNDLLVRLGSPAGSWVDVIAPKDGSAYEAMNYDVLLADAFTSGLHDNRGDDNTSMPYFDRQARPSAPLNVFKGENAAGTWTLTICDTNPSANDGAYNLSQLLLMPENTTSQNGAWSYTVSGLEDLDYVAQVLEVYATDLAGNRTPTPIRLDFVIDNVAPGLGEGGGLAPDQISGHVRLR
jgi:subtilisin-like proprotein convertase family protein